MTRKEFYLKDIYWVYIAAAHTSHKYYFPLFYKSGNIYYLKNIKYNLDNEIAIAFKYFKLHNIKKTHSVSFYTKVGTLTIFHAPYLYITAIENYCFRKYPNETFEFLNFNNNEIEINEFVKFISCKKISEKHILSLASPFKKSINLLKTKKAQHLDVVERYL